MKILALETTEKFGSAALLNGSHILAEVVLPKDRRSSQTLHPAIQSLFESTQTTPRDIDIVAVVAGPGSFTGLRVGVTAAKVFAYTTGAKIIALDTFQTVAFGCEKSNDSTSLISVGVDAQRGEVVTAIVRRTADGLVETVREPKLIPLADWWNDAEQPGVLFSGPALERWSTKAPPHVVLAPESDWFPRASSAGQLAAVSHQPVVDAWSLLPVYSRLSAAEEKRQGV